MTKLRYVVMMTSVVLFSLALGIALGGGPLQGPMRGVLQSQMEAVTGANGRELAALKRENHELAGSVAYDRQFAEEVSPDLLGTALSDRTVVVLSLPGVPQSVTEAVAGDVQTAGGSVTTTLGVGRELVDPTARPLVDELSKRLLDDDLEDVAVPEGTSVYTRVGVVAARALLTSADEADPMDDSARSIFNTFTTAGLLTGDEPEQRASTAIVLLPEKARPSATSGGRSTILTELVAAMDDASSGVVVGGPRSAADAQGLLAAVRSSAATAESVSTVDSAWQRGGQVVTVLALAREAGGTTGHYGTGDGADSMLP
ncbi:MAG TPA: copper transporter [Nocardioidaceae bacterium]|nr:copper transporter [Nocardioidaceae bacterium]